VVIGGATFDFRVLIPFLAILIKKNTFLEINEYPFVTRKENLWKTLLLLFFFRVVVPAYKGFIVISEALEIEINKYRNKDSRIIRIPILSELLNCTKSFSLPPDPVPYILHAGSLIEQKDGILGSLKAFAKTRRRLGYEIHYILSGDLNTSPNRNEIEKILRDEDLVNSVVFTGYLDKMKLADYYSHASLAVINKSVNKQNEYCFATKISEYITYGIPLVLTPVGEVKNYFIDGYNALFVQPDNVEQISDALVCLLNDREKAGFLANNAMLLLETELNTSLNGSKLKRFLENCS
jgi:glycosyltransferase involved in cell wall biosynthesis